MPRSKNSWVLPSPKRAERRTLKSETMPRLFCRALHGSAVFRRALPHHLLEALAEVAACGKAQRIGDLLQRTVGGGQQHLCTLDFYKFDVVIDGISRFLFETACGLIFTVACQRR